MATISPRMQDAIRTGADGAVVFCERADTESALIRHGLIHPVQSTLTEYGQQVLAGLLEADAAAQAATGGTVHRPQSCAQDADAPAEWEGFAFSRVAVGDYVRFQTRETGFDGRGLYYREGWVIRVTESSMVVRVGHNETARISAQSFMERDVARKPGIKVPYHPDFAHRVVRGANVTVIWSPFPIIDAAAVVDNFLDARYRDVETVAEAARFTKAEGADFSGWVVRSGLDYSDPRRTRKAALEQLEMAVADYFGAAVDYLRQGPQPVEDRPTPMAAKVAAFQELAKELEAAGLNVRALL